MKTFNKIALVTAIATVSSTSFAALQSLDEAQLSNMTGQDGITITIEPGQVEAANGDQFDGIYIQNAYVHDTDGLPTGSTIGTGNSATAIVGASGTSGVIQVNDIRVESSSDIQVIVDTDGGATTNDNSDAFVNATIKLGAADIKLGQISVGESAADKTGIIRGTADNGANSEILSGLDLSLGATDINVQLGSQPQGALAVINGSIDGGLGLKDIGLTDAANANFAGTGYDKGEGTLYIGNVEIADTGATTLTNDIAIGIDDDQGLVVALKTDGIDIAIERVGFTTPAGAAANDFDTNTFANTNFIGDVYLQGLQTGTSVISINGH